MKLLIGILTALLIVSVWYNIKLSNQNTKEALVTTQAFDKTAPLPKSESDPKLQLVIHLDDPVSSIERFYNLFPGTELNEVFIGNINPSSDTAAQITQKLKLPRISGQDPFPRDQLNTLIEESPNGKFLHFANLKIGQDSLGFGSTQTTRCKFPNQMLKNQPIGQIIPWFKIKLNAKQTFKKALEIGYDGCGEFEKNEAYIIDPLGFIILLDGNK